MTQEEIFGHVWKTFQASITKRTFFSGHTVEAIPETRIGKIALTQPAHDVRTTLYGH